MNWCWHGTTVQYPEICLPKGSDYTDQPSDGNKAKQKKNYLWEYYIDGQLSSYISTSVACMEQWLLASIANDCTTTTSRGLVPILRCFWWNYSPVWLLTSIALAPLLRRGAINKCWHVCCAGSYWESNGWLHEPVVCFPLFFCFKQCDLRNR